MNFAFTFTAVSIISSYSIGYVTSLQVGGPVVMVWCWVIGSFFTILVGAPMAEICSTYPSAGSVYHWAGQLAKKERAPFASYMTGWFNFLGNAAGDAAFASGFASCIASAVALNPDLNQLDTNAQVGIAIAILFGWSVFNCMNIKHQGYISTFAAIYQVLSSIIMVIVVLAGTPLAERATGEWVFTYFNNETGWEVNGYVVVIGLLNTLFSFSGYEAGGHIAEETMGARVAAPRGILGCCLVAAVLGFIYIVGLLFATPMCNSFEGEPLSNCTGSITSVYSLGGINTPQGLALTGLLVVNLFFAGTSSITVTTRIGYAMARDGAFPFSKPLSWIFQPTKVPLTMVWFVFVVDCVLILIQLGSTAAFTSILSICTIGFQISYAIPIFLRVTDARNTFKQSAFNLGRFSHVIGWISAIWLFFTSCIFFWPTYAPVNADDMNYTIVIVGGTVIIAVFFWFVAARKYFRGPERGDETEESSQVALEERKVEENPQGDQTI